MPSVLEKKQRYFNKEEREQEDYLIAQRVMVENPLLWAKWNKLKLQGGEFSIEEHKYQEDVLLDQSKEIVVEKAAQLGFTETFVIKILHSLLYELFPKGALYLFPTGDDVSDFSKARFNPLIAHNPCIYPFVKDTDATNIKQINKAMLYLRGARATKAIEGVKKSSSKLKSIPVDAITFDERDEMDDDMVTLALERVSHSEMGCIYSLSTPSIPDYGIDLMYQKSDQKIWEIKCQHCGKYTCLEMNFPDCLGERSDGSVFRMCRYCKKEIYPRDGRWVKRYQDRKVSGYWISQLNSIYVDPAKLLDAYLNPPNGNLSEFYNSKMGIAYIPAENLLTPEDVYSCCGVEGMAYKHPGGCGMGVDVGSKLHYVIGHRTYEKYGRIIKVGTVDKFEDLHDLVDRFGINVIVIDKKPEIHKGREFQKNEKRAMTFLCDYSEFISTSAVWSVENGDVKVNRTEVCDQSHSKIVNHHLELPRMNDDIREFARHCSALVKVKEEDKTSGGIIYRYRKRGEDHYRHALNYFLLACERLTPVGKYGYRQSSRVSFLPTAQNYMKL